MKIQGYVSEFEQFLDQYKQTHPNVEADQRRGWNIWWDHNLDLTEVDRARQDSVPVSPYYYS